MSDSINLVIRVTEPRLVELPNVQPKLDTDGNVLEDGYVGYRLKPGENDVPSAYWDRITHHKGVKILLACKTLVNEGPGKAKSLVNNLDELAPDTALKHIGNCENVAVLNDWKAGTQTLGYKQAIDERIGELVAGQTGEAAGASHTDTVDPVVEAELTD